MSTFDYVSVIVAIVAASLSIISVFLLFRDHRKVRGGVYFITPVSPDEIAMKLLAIRESGVKKLLSSRPDSMTLEVNVREDPPKNQATLTGRIDGKDERVVIDLKDREDIEKLVSLLAEGARAWKKRRRMQRLAKSRQRRRMIAEQLSGPALRRAK